MCAHVYDDVTTSAPAELPVQCLFPTVLLQELQHFCHRCSCAIHPTLAVADNVDKQQNEFSRHRAKLRTRAGGNNGTNQRPIKNRQQLLDALALETIICKIESVNVTRATLMQLVQLGHTHRDKYGYHHPARTNTCLFLLNA